MAIHYFQFNAYNGVLSFYNAKNQLVTIAKEAVPTHLITPILDVLENLKTEEESQIEKLEAENAEAKEKLKRAQDHLAELLTGTPGATMTDDMAAQYPELKDGIAIDAGDYYREEGGKILYRAKKDMVYDHATMAPTGAHGSDYWIGSGLQEKKPPTSEYKYPKGTEKEYLGTMYYACVDTNDEPDVGYPIWDLLANKPKD